MSNVLRSFSFMVDLVVCVFLDVPLQFYMRSSTGRQLRGAKAPLSDQHHRVEMSGCHIIPGWLTLQSRDKHEYAFKLLDEPIDKIRSAQHEMQNTILLR